jgi:hypothetical protein
MRTVKLAVRALIACGASLLVLGIVIWTGHGDQLISLHIAIGVVLVLTLWTLAAIAARSGVRAGTVAFATAWGLVIVLLGLAHEDLVVGSLHWTIQVVHVVLSMGAIWWGRRLAKLIGRARAGSRSSVAPPVATSTSRVDETV